MLHLNSDDSAKPSLSGRATARIHRLWDEIADFGAHEVDQALVHTLGVLSELVGAQNAFWLGAVRLAADVDAPGGWRIRAIRRLSVTAEDVHVDKLSRLSLDKGRSDAVTLAQLREAGSFRARLLRELATPEFFATRDYDILYRARNINDAIFVAFPVNEDAESYFGWYRTGAQRAKFTERERDLLEYALRALKWFHRRVMLHHGLLIARAPLTPMERRLVSLLLTRRGEREIARDLALTLATTHTYITTLFRKFGVHGRAALTALWLGNSPA